MFDCVIFDWDGTLMDSTSTIARCIELACLDLGLPKPAGQSATWVIGLGLADALQWIAPSLTPDDLPAFVAAYRRHYFANDHLLTLFPGIRDLLQALRSAQVPTAVATGKPRAGLERAWAHAELKTYFVDSCCADETASKPSPRMVLELCARMAVAPSRTLVVGDTVHDIQMARAAGCSAVAVSYGAHDRATLAHERPDAIVDDVAELRRYFVRCGILPD